MTNPSQRSVLIVEDDADLRQTLAESLETAGFSVAECADAAAATERLEAFAYDGLVVDLHLPDANGMTVLENAVARYPDIKAVVMTGFGGVVEAVDAIKHGAIDFLIKPFQLTQLARVIGAAIDQQRLRLENAELRAQLRGRFGFDSIVGRDRAMQELFSTLELISPMNSTVLIQGETGTGKELVARTIHHHSPRAEHRFVAFNAAALPESLIEAELFGHAKGAFTGAVAARVGRFELAHKGTLFIDEVALMPLVNAGQAAARASGARVRAARRLEDVESGHPRDRGHQRRSAAARQGRQVPRGPLLPPDRHSCDAASASRAPCEMSRCSRST